MAEGENADGRLIRLPHFCWEFSFFALIGPAAYRGVLLLTAMVIQLVGRAVFSSPAGLIGGAYTPFAAKMRCRSAAYRGVLLLTAMVIRSSAAAVFSSPAGLIGGASTPFGQDVLP